tara:strand:+ start:207595 stop:208035 length:441 start_codon:yes stop_codon:yes gene_type:complete
MTDVTIRPLLPEDSAGWHQLWQGYNRFYERSVEDRTTQRVWDALQSGTGQPFGVVAAQGEVLLGFAHYFFLPSTADWGPRCYMQDLFTAPSARGRGVGRRLIEAVYAAADENGAAQTYWLTADSNTVAQGLYDRVAQRTEFVKYRR